MNPGYPIPRINAKNKVKSQDKQKNKLSFITSNEYQDFLNLALKNLLIHLYEIFAIKKWNSFGDIDFISKRIVSFAENILDVGVTRNKIEEKNMKIIKEFNKKYNSTNIDSKTFKTLFYILNHLKMILKILLKIF